MFQNWNGLFGLHKLIGFDSRCIEDFAVVDAMDILVGIMTVNGDIQKVRRIEVIGIDLLTFDGELSLLIDRCGHGLGALKAQPGGGNLVMIPAGLRAHHG